MNLHIAPDNSFTNKFYENLQEIGAVANNHFMIRTNYRHLRSIRYHLPCAPLYSKPFDGMVGDTVSYDKVFIHYFTPLLYRWVVKNNFRELNWMVWGGDLYNLPELDEGCYEPLTKKHYVRKNFSWQTTLYNLKVAVTQKRYRERAYQKVNNILTWMNTEYNFACSNLPVKARHKFFFYENAMPYQALDKLPKKNKVNDLPRLIIGNSASPANNHLDVIAFLNNHKVKAELYIPVSYGDARYVRFLQRNIRYLHGTVTFLNRYLPFEEYLDFLNSTDGLIMNTIRPQGYGNILMMMYLGKPVYFNNSNLSLPDLRSAGFRINVLDDLLDTKSSADADNKEAVTRLLSHERLLKTYQTLF